MNNWELWLASFVGALFVIDIARWSKQKHAPATAHLHTAIKPEARTVTPTPTPQPNAVPPAFAALLVRLEAMAKRVQDPQNKANLQLICTSVSKFFERRSLNKGPHESTAKMEIQLTRLTNSVERYIDIESNRELYEFDGPRFKLFSETDPEKLLAMTTQAIAGVADFIRSEIQKDNLAGIQALVVDNTLLISENDV